MERVPLVGGIGVVAVSGSAKCLYHISVVVADIYAADMTINPGDVASASVVAARGAIALGSGPGKDIAASVIRIAGIVAGPTL